MKTKTYKNIKDNRKTQLYGNDEVEETTPNINLHRVTNITIKEDICHEKNKLIKISVNTRTGEKITLNLFLAEEE